MTETNIATLQKQASFLRQRISDIRIDYPEAADARRDELALVESQIADLRRAPEPTAYTVDPSDGEQARPIPTDPVSETARRCAEIARELHSTTRRPSGISAYWGNVSEAIEREFGLEEQA